MENKECMKLKFIKCPICKGVGKLIEPKPLQDMKLKASIAKDLLKQGFSYRQVMKLMDYKSPASVRSLKLNH